MANGAIGVGKIFGIPIEVHWTLIMFSLLFLLLPAIAIVLLITLYICVLAHELAHAANALRNGIKVKRIILSFMGGATVVDDINIDPRVEFNITMSGPIMSILLGAAFGVAEIFTGAGTLSYVLNWLFVVNIALGILNLIPIFPLDGGRILRSYLQRKRDFYDATMLTAKVSKYMIGISVVAVAIYILLNNQSIFYNEVIAFITLITIFYIYGGLKAETSGAIIRKETHGVSIGTLASKSYSIVTSNTTIRKLYERIAKGRGKLFIMKQKDGVYLLNLSARPNKEVKYARDLGYKISSVDSKSNVSDVLAKMENDDMSIVAVERNGRFIGIVTNAQIQSFIFLHMLKGKAAKL